MGAYEYSALAQNGKSRKGVLEGDTPRQIRQQLRDKGLTPLEIHEVKEQKKKGSNTSVSIFQRINAKDLALITRQFSTLIRAGLPIEEAILAVSQQCEKPRLQSMLVAIRSRVMEGHTLAYAMGEFSNVFSDLYRATVSAGEQSGHLDVVLERLADYTENRQTLGRKITEALIYPIFIIVSAVGIVALLMVVVVPKVVKMFDNIGQELPWLTQALISVSDFVGAYILVILFAIIALIFLVRSILKRSGPKYRFHQIQLATPFLSRLVKGLNAARFARTLSILTQSGVAVLEALKIASEVVINLPMRDAVSEAAEAVKEGSSLHMALDKSGYFPPMTIHLIAGGEASGNLEVMLDRAASSQERDLEAIIQMILSLFGPVVILLMAGVVFVIVMAMMLPLINLNQLVT